MSTGIEPEQPQDPQLNPTAPVQPDAAVPTGPQSDPPPDTTANAIDTTMADVEKEVAEAMAELGEGGFGGLNAAEVGADQPEPGAEIIGTVANVSDEDIFLEFGAKLQGIVPRSQFGKKEPLEVGRRIDVVVESYDAESSLLIVSRKGAIQRATWVNLKKGMIVDGRAVGVIKGGLEINLNGIRAFMPASHTDIVQIKDVSTLLNQTLRCEVLEVDRRKKNVLLSRRKVLQREIAEKREALEAELDVGQTRHGVVSRIAEFGAFVNLGGIDGLLHISDLKWGNVDKVTDVLKEGQEVEVKVLKIDKERNRISLGLKQLAPNPWDGVADRFHEGTNTKVRIIRLASFGAFAELEPGIEGLIPLSEFSWSRVNQPSDAVSEGDMVDAVVIRVEPGKQRIALSMKQSQPDPWAVVLDSYPEKSLVTGKVTRLADFGVFVELVPGVEGMIHISELAEGRVNTCSDVVQPGQEVEARVLGVDKEKRRISLSIKAVAEAPAGAEQTSGAAQATQAPPKKRKKKLRGGLSSHFDW